MTSDSKVYANSLKKTSIKSDVSLKETPSLSLEYIEAKQNIGL